MTLDLVACWALHVHTSIMSCVSGWSLVLCKFMVVELMENDVGEMMGIRFEECHVELKGTT